MNSLPFQRPSGGTPTTADFNSLQTLWAKILNPLIAAFTANANPPIGTIWSFGGTTAPEGFIVCSGQVVLQKLYPALFRVIGTSFNTGGEAAGSFRLPAAATPPVSYIIRAKT